MQDYLGELRANWRALLSATLGISSGLAIFGYTAGIMGPAQVREFQWPQAWLALIPTFSFVGIFIYPFVGRIADRYGARPTAAIGVIASPLIYLSLANMQNFTTYMVILILQTFLLLTTTAQVYSQVIVQYFTKARGLALAIASSGPPAIAMIGAPYVNGLVADHGWRAGYLAVSIYTLVLGVAALAIMPRRRIFANSEDRRGLFADFRAIARMRSFWILFVSMIMVNLPAMPLLTQMNLILAEAGTTGKATSALISIYAMGSLAGRLISGALLDRLPARQVAAGSLALSAVGLFTLSMHPESYGLLLAAMLLVGLAYGAETDILGYLISRYFGIGIYSTVFSMVGAGITIASASGGLILSGFLTWTGHYYPFLMTVSLVALIGSSLLLLLPRHGVAIAPR
jgi:MFS family permease